MSRGTRSLWGLVFLILAVGCFAVSHVNVRARAADMAFPVIQVEMTSPDEQSWNSSSGVEVLLCVGGVGALLGSVVHFLPLGRGRRRSRPVDAGAVYEVLWERECEPAGGPPGDSGNAS